MSNATQVSNFNCRFPGVPGAEPTHCENCGNLLVPDRETVAHCDQICFESWQEDERVKSELTAAEAAAVRKVSDLLAAQSTLVDLFHTWKDSRGLRLAEAFESQAHQLWREAGFQDIPTHGLVRASKRLSR
jgi:hypothetical protein